MSVDIVGIGNQQIEYPAPVRENFDTLETYLDIAKKTIRTFANRFYSGLAEEMLKSEDAISNVATSIMMADWRWNPNYRSEDGKVRTKRCYRNQCAIWAIQGYIGRKVKNKKVMSLDADIYSFDGNMSLKDVVSSKQLEPDIIAIKTEELDFLIEALEKSSLTDMQKEYLQRYYIDGETLQEIANDAGSSREAVRQTLERGLSKIRQFNGVEYEREKRKTRHGFRQYSRK